ncbi:MAG: hypothetical protein P1T08_01805 [Acidimicrobiia bacterium]|nr:hypothetical protein [Acidimicrobiia bacterium]
MARSFLAVVFLLAACSGEAASTTVALTADTTTTSTTPAVSTTSLPTLESCDDVPYRALVVPGRVAGAETSPKDLGNDPLTAIPGTSLKLWVDADSAPVMALVRGSLPPVAWAGPTARIEVVREDAALGPLPGDIWAVAWFESEDRCDLYTLILYPPTSADEALEVAESLIPDR